MASASAVSLALFLALIAFLVSQRLGAGARGAFPSEGVDCRGAPLPSMPTLRVFTDDVLNLHNGEVPKPQVPGGSVTVRALLLVVLGEVYDVSSGTKFYERPPDVVFGKDAVGYNIFVGRDSSRAYATGDFVTPRADLDELTPAQVNSVVEWRTFYRNHKSYELVGVHAGLYYNCQGEATDALVNIEAIAQQAQKASESETAMLAQFTSCNSIFKPAEKFSEVSCPDGVRVPRRLFWKSAASTAAHATSGAAPVPPSAEQQRCVCLTPEAEADIRTSQPPASVGGLRTEEFENCPNTATSCRLTVA